MDKNMKIYSIHYNKPEFIILQKRSIDKYIKFPNEFIILDNSVDPVIKNDIRNITQHLSLQYIDCNNNLYSNDSISHQNALSKIKDIVSDGETFMIIDHDVFIISNLFESYFDKHDMVYLNQTRGTVNYPSTVLIIFNKIKNKSQISFISETIDGHKCDTGGGMYHYIKDNNVCIKYMNEGYIESGPMLMSILDNIFIHLISGSDWNKDYNLNGKIEYIKKHFEI